ncbi:MAG: class I SAM-dependent methyltransferase [Candidatus Heimdallarchaeota archaeon]|nr:MAG: class I SAM-dependent methyltransferase [Candidatus Heimdallarchaeota archaeon]
MSCRIGCFDWASSFYDYTRAIPDELMNKIMKSFQENVKLTSKSRMLDIGIGTGRIAIPLARKLHLTTVGIDISIKMLQKCLEKTTSCEEVQIINADALALPFQERQFEIILMCHILHFLPNAYHFIESLRPLLVPHCYYILLEAYVDYSRSIPYQIYYNKLKDLGYRKNQKYHGISRRGITVYLSKRGWKHDLHTSNATRIISTNDIVHFIRDRVFSSQRAIPEDLHRQSFGFLSQEIERRNINLSFKVKAPATSYLTIFQQTKK